MALKLKRVKHITGVPVAGVKGSLFVMALIKAQLFSQLH